MAATTKRQLILALLAVLGLPVHAANVACHLTYGGETRIVSAAPTSDPYSVAPVAIGSYFLFRIVFRQQPADLAAIKLYTYADRASGPTLIYQATYPYPPPGGIDGFTGRHFVYEPARDGELQYWCELQHGS